MNFGSAFSDESDEPGDVILVDGVAEEIPKLQLVSTSADLPRVVLLTDALGPADLAGLFALGVRAVLPRDSTLAEIAAALEAVALDLVALAPELFESLLPAEKHEPETAEFQEPLTRAKRKCLGCSPKARVTKRSPRS